MKPTTLQTEIDWLKKVINNRLQQHLSREAAEHFLAPSYEDIDDPYVDFIKINKATAVERFVLMLALAPHLQPELLDLLILGNLKESGNFPQIGGVKGKQHRGFLPTGETALFLLAGSDIAERMQIAQLFSEEHWFARQGILSLGAPAHGEPNMSGKLLLHPDILDRLATGKAQRPKFSMSFPAELLETKMAWDDLIINTGTAEQLQELEVWLQHHETIMRKWGMKKFLKPGYRSMFYGPPGTGKTLTATLLGKRTGRQVFRVDLSMVVSKYIGETEKNLANLFSRAANKDWILFFDEADALFSKRTGVRDAHDKYANQEVAFLLQKIEHHNGLVILATNFKSNIDEAFLRRFQAIIHFPPPNEKERLLLWKNTLPADLPLEEGMQLRQLARKYQLTGSNIANIVQKLCLLSLGENRPLVLADFVALIRQEFEKEGKLL